MYELWFRAVYEDDLSKGNFASAVRPGSRLPGENKGVGVGEVVNIRVLDRPGDESAGLKPLFRTFERLARITSLEVKKISELTTSDLRSCSPDARDPDKIGYHLGLIYNRRFARDELVTILSWEYTKEV